MKKALLLLVILSIFSCLVVFANSEYDLRGYDGIEVGVGTFVRVVNTKEISTSYFDEGDKVKFIVAQDVWLGETNVIPENSEFIGYVEKLNEPIIGTNGSMKIKLNKLVLTDGFEIPTHAYIYSSNNNVIGGELSKPAKYDRMPHYQYGFWLGTNQWVPGEKRAMGEHTVISSGAEMIVVITSPLFITHVVN